MSRPQVVIAQLKTIFTALQALLVDSTLGTCEASKFDVCFVPADPKKDRKETSFDDVKKMCPPCRAKWHFQEGIYYLNYYYRKEIKRLLESRRVPSLQPIDESGEFPAK